MQGGLFGLPTSLPPGIPTSLPPGIPTSIDAVKQQAIDAAKAKAQNSATSVMSSDAVQSGLAKAEGLAGSVGLGDQFAKVKDKAIGAIEKATGLKLSAPTACPPDRIDVPVLTDVLVATAETPYDATTTMDSLFSYVVVDSRNPPEAETTQKSRLWYISIANATCLIVLGMLYSQANK